MPLEPIIGKSEPVPSDSELAEAIRAALASMDDYYARRIKLWVYFSVGVGVGIVLGMLLGELIF